MLEIKNLKKEVKNKVEQYPVISNISFILDNTGITFIDSDDKNKYLINILLGFDKEYDGDIRANGKLIRNFNNYEYDIYRTNYISYIPLKTILLKDATVKANIKMAGELNGRTMKKVTLNSLLLRFGLNEQQNYLGKELDKYTEKVVDIARAVAKEPDVILVDNPNLVLNNNDANLIYKTLEDIAKNKQIIIFTNDKNAAKAYGNRYIKIRKGVITEDTNKIEEVKNTKPFEFKATRLLKKYISSLSFSLMSYSKLLTFLLIISMFNTIFSYGIRKSIDNINFSDYHKSVLQNNKETEVKVAKYNTKMMFNESVKNNFHITQDMSKIKGSKIALSNELIKEITDNTKKEFVKEYKIAKNGKNIGLSFPNIVNENEIYYKKDLDINLINYTSKDIINDEIIGNYPKKDDEILISKYIAESMIKGGIDTDSESIFKPKSVYQIINYDGKIYIDGLGYFKVVGVVNTDTSIYKDIKNLGQHEFDNSIKYNSMYNQLKYDIESKYSRIFFNNGYIDTLIYKNNKSLTKTRLENGSYVNSFSYINNKITAFNGNIEETYTSLTDRVVIIDLDILNMNTNFDYELKLNKALIDNPNLDVTKFTKDYIVKQNIIGSRLKINLNKNVISSDTYTEYFIGGVDLKSNSGNIIFSKNVVGKLINSGKEVYSLYYISNDTKDLNSVLDKFSFDNDTLLLQSKYSDNILSITNTLYVINYAANLLFKISLPISIIFLLLLIFNSYKKAYNMISMFRYLGITRNSINLVFKSEMQNISIIVALFTGFALFFSVKYLNIYFTSLITVNSTILSYNIVSIVIMIAGLIGTYIVSTLLLSTLVKTNNDIKTIKKVQ